MDIKIPPFSPHPGWPNEKRTEMTGKPGTANGPSGCQESILKGVDGKRAPRFTSSAPRDCFTCINFQQADETEGETASKYSISTV